MYVCLRLLSSWIAYAELYRRLRGMGVNANVYIHDINLGGFSVVSGLYRLWREKYLYTFYIDMNNFILCVT